MPSTKYSAVSIIYNPMSTSGHAEQKATHLANRLQKQGLPCVTHATEYGGHAEILAYETATKHSHPLIISVSGDGGYNEVINGAMRAQTEYPQHTPVCAILAAGNANDHRRTVRKRPLAWAITHSTPESMDILRLVATKNNQLSIRYAHSYIGFGVSSLAAAELNRQRLTRWRELRIVLETVLFKFSVLRIYDNHHRIKKLDSLVFANIHQMSKVIKLGKKTNLHDGLFRVATLPHHHNPARRLITLISIATVGFRNPPQRAAYEFSTIKDELVHLDGEVITIAGGSHVKIEAIQEALLTVR